MAVRTTSAEPPPRVGASAEQSGTRYNSSTYSASLCGLSDLTHRDCLEALEEEYRDSCCACGIPQRAVSRRQSLGTLAAIPADMSEMTGIETNIRHLPFRMG